MLVARRWEGERKVPLFFQGMNEPSEWRGGDVTDVDPQPSQHLEAVYRVIPDSLQTQSHRRR